MPDLHIGERHVIFERVVPKPSPRARTVRLGADRRVAPQLVISRGKDGAEEAVGSGVVRARKHRHKEQVLCDLPVAPLNAEGEGAPLADQRHDRAAPGHVLVGILPVVDAVSVAHEGTLRQTPGAVKSPLSG